MMEGAEGRRALFWLTVLRETVHHVGDGMAAGVDLAVKAER